MSPELWLNKENLTRVGLAIAGLTCYQRSYVAIMLYNREKHKLYLALGFELFLERSSGFYTYSIMDIFSVLVEEFDETRSCI